MATKITIDLEAQTAQFVSGVEKAGTSLRTFGETAHHAGERVNYLLEGLGVGTGIELAEKGFEALKEGIDSVKEAFEDVGKIGRDALRLGISTEQMSRFQHAANAAHVDVSQLSTGMDHLNREIGKVASGDAGGKAAA